MSTMPTYDYETEQADLLRRLQVAQAMQQGGLAPMGPTEMVGGYAVKRSPLEGLNKVAQVLASKKMMGSISDEQRALGERYRGDMKSGLERFFNTLEGTSATIPGGEGSDAYGGQIDYKGDPRRAVIEAMASNHPGLQQIGQAYMKELGKDRLTMKDLVALATPESVIGNPNTPQAWKPKRELKAVAPGEVLLDAGGNVATPGSGAGLPPQAPGTATTPGAPQGQAISGPGWTTVKIGGDTYQMTATGLKKLDNATKVTNNNNVGVNVAGQKAGLEEWAKLAGKTVNDMAGNARQSVKLMGQLNQLEALSRGGTNQGPAADAATFIQGLASAAGIPVDKNKLNNSQAFASVATQAWAALMQQNGGARGLVKEESDRLAQSLPSLVQTPQGRAQITAVLRQAAQQNISDAQRANQEYAKALRSQDPAAFTFGLSSTELPQSPPVGPAPGGVSGGVMSLDDYLKSKGAR